MSLLHVRPSVNFEDVYHNSTKFFIRFGLIVGVFPISRSSEGTYEFRWVSTRTLYSTFIYVLTSFAVTYSTYVKMLNFRNPKLPFDEYLVTLIYIICLAPHWPYQVISVASSKGIAEYLTMWTKFQKHYFEVTGSTIKFNYSVKFIRILSFGIAMAVASTTSQTAMQDAYTLSETLGFYHVLTLSIFLCVWWSLQSAAFVCAARNLREKMRNELMENPIRVEIKSYRYLWEEIYELIEKMSSSMGCLYGVYNFVIYLSVFIPVYSSVAQMFASQDTSSFIKLAGFLICSTYFGVHLYGFCNSAHFLEEEIAHVVKYDLMKIDLCKLSDRNVKEVHLFLDTINSKEVGLMVYGNFTIRRGTLTDYASSMAMYCLVLLQFKITLPQED